jgi:hypothetical protein
MRVRIVKTPPAYVIDGFEMRGLRAGGTYDLEPRLANYVVRAEFGVVADDNSESVTAPPVGESERSKCP